MHRWRTQHKVWRPERTRFLKLDNNFLKRRRRKKKKGTLPSEAHFSSLHFQSSSSNGHLVWELIQNPQPSINETPKKIFLKNFKTKLREKLSPSLSIPVQTILPWWFRHSFSGNQIQTQCLYLYLPGHMKRLLHLSHVPRTFLKGWVS